MLKIIISTFVLSVALSAANFMAFGQFNYTFVIHNLFALIFGIVFMALSYKHLRNKKTFVPYANFFLGVIVTAIHVIKLTIGNCI